MKNALSVLLCTCWLFSVNAQSWNEDSLRTVVSNTSDERAEVDALVCLGYLQQNADSIFYYGRKALAKAKAIAYQKGQADGLLLLRGAYDRQSNFSQAIQSSLDALSIYEHINDYVGAVSAHGMLQGLYREVGDYRKSLDHATLGFKLAEAHNVRGLHLYPGHRWAPLLLAEMGQTYLLMNKLDSALLYTRRSIAQNELFNGVPWEFPIYLEATILTQKGEYATALDKYRMALSLCVPNGVPWDTLQIYSGLSTLFRLTNQQDSAVHYASVVARNWKSPSEYKNLLEALGNLAFLYKEKGKLDSALRYTELSHAIKDSLFGAEKDREVQGIAFAARLKEEQGKEELRQRETKVKLYGLVAGLAALLLIAAILYRSNQHKQKAYAQVQRQKQETENAYDQLKATQQQLIQQEKMASLGELTAGIAHEIQNPLNFVNNFSEANNELLDDLEHEAQRGNLQEVITLITDIRQNEEKINHHGRRADSIVKGMLQHSRTSNGKKEIVNINELVGEYLRLSYHGFRVKDSSFAAVLETHYSEAAGQLSIVPQDVGRVLLNLFNNAFYALSQKKKSLDGAFTPTVSVSTGRTEKQVVITVSDNGAGMSETVAARIFQPFFTTKPAGEGTGLGLSLSYDIITKGHGGHLHVRSTEGKGTEFLVELPCG